MQNERPTEWQGTQHRTVTAMRTGRSWPRGLSRDAVARCVRRVLRTGTATNGFERFVLQVAGGRAADPEDHGRVESDAISRVLRRLRQAGGSLS